MLDAQPDARVRAGPASRSDACWHAATGERAVEKLEAAGITGGLGKRKGDGKNSRKAICRWGTRDRNVTTAQDACSPADVGAAPALQQLRAGDRHAHGREGEPGVWPRERHADQNQAVVAARDQQAAPAHQHAAGEAAGKLRGGGRRMAPASGCPAARHRAEQQGEQQQAARRQVGRHAARELGEHVGVGPGADQQQHDDEGDADHRGGGMRRPDAGGERAMPCRHAGLRDPMRARTARRSRARARTRRTAAAPRRARAEPAIRARASWRAACRTADRR